MGGKLVRVMYDFFLEPRTIIKAITWDVHESILVCGIIFLRYSNIA